MVIGNKIRYQVLGTRTVNFQRVIRAYKPLGAMAMALVETTLEVVSRV